MILYHVISTYHLLNAMVERMVNHQSDNAVVLIPIWIVEKYKNYQELLRIFDKIIVYNANYCYHVNLNIELNNKYINDLFQQNNCNIRDFKEINVWGCQFSFGYYLSCNFIPFIFWEEGAGLLSRPEILEDINYKIKREDHFYSIKEKGLFDGTSPCVIKHVCKLDAQVDNYCSDKVENFDVINHLKELDEEKQNIIIHFFLQGNKIDIPSNSTIFLTQHFANLSILSFEDQILIYQIVMDYFMKNKKVVFKPHPDDIMYYSELFPDCIIIKEKFPSELLPIIFTNQPNEIATISSTGIANLRKYYQKSFQLNTRYENDFKATHRYYITMHIIKNLMENVADSCIVNGLGANLLLLTRLNELCEFSLQLDIIEKSTITNETEYFIIDDITKDENLSEIKVKTLLENLPDKSKVIMINSKQDFCFHDTIDKTIWKNIVAIPIKKKKIKFDSEDFYAELKEEVIYFYSKEEKYKEKIKNMNVTKELDYTGIEISVTPMTDEQQRIKILEGILEATEKRLLYYIERVKQLEEVQKK